MSRSVGILSRLAALVFLGFGLAKFVNHGTEVDSFRDYDLPSPDAFVYAIGAIEVIGGALLLLGIGLRFAVPVLAADMVGAIVVSGIAKGEPISLTLAPALLIILVLVWFSGNAAGDTRRA
jgi:uncharacterized membrane protein YphA (DoxX/SURF4 family)